MQGNYKRNPYGFEQVDESIPTDTSLPVNDQQQAQQIPQGYNPNIGGYPQVPPQNYFVPVNGPNGVMFVPVQNGYPTFNAPIQGQPIYGQQFVQPNNFYVPPVQVQPQGPDCFERITNFFRNSDETQKYQLLTRVMFIIFVAATIFQVISGMKRHFHPWLIFGIVQTTLFALTYCTARRALKMKSLNMMKRFIRRGRIMFWITVYNIFMLMFMAHTFGCPLICTIIVAIAHGWTLCKGKKLYKNQLKEAWAGIQDPCPRRGWCCRGNGNCN